MNPLGDKGSGVGGFEGSRVRHQQLPRPPPLYEKKFLPDFYVSHGPH